MRPQHRDLIRRSVLESEDFRRAVFTRPTPPTSAPWNRVTVRPVAIKGTRHLQFSYFTKDKDTSKNARGDDAAARLDELLALPFAGIRLESGRGIVQIQVTRKGSVAHNVSAPTTALEFAHDRRKARALDERSGPFLSAIGITTADGRVKPSMAGKFQQVNEFLKLLSHTGELEKIERRPISVVDLGCGSAHLTFATYHYLNDILGIPARFAGVDLKTEVIEKQNAQARRLGWPEIAFHSIGILEFQPDAPPDIVLALHACDTATDEALAQAIQWKSRLILSAPCCHHHLHAQLSRRDPPEEFAAIWRDGILRERWGDILTDTFRALILRIMGYRTDVVEFVATEHTARNLLIRAVRGGGADDRPAAEYTRLKGAWRVTPHLETLLGERLAAAPGRT